MRKNHGFTLIELVMTLVIFGVITAALSAGLAHIVRDFTVARGATERLFEVDAGLSLLERAMRKASNTSDIAFDREPDRETGFVKTSEGTVLLTGVRSFALEEKQYTLSGSAEGLQSTLSGFNLQTTTIPEKDIRVWQASVKVRFAEGFEPVEINVTVPGVP